MKEKPKLGESKRKRDIPGKAGIKDLMASILIDLIPDGRPLI
jgi:hypothetical protein